MRALILVAGAALAVSACDNDEPHRPNPGDVVVNEPDQGGNVGNCADRPCEDEAPIS